MITLKRALYRDDDGQLQEKDTKTHQQRRVALDDDTVDVVTEHRLRRIERACALDVPFLEDSYVFVAAIDPSAPPSHETMTQRYGRMATWLGSIPTCTACGITRPPS